MIAANACYLIPLPLARTCACTLTRAKSRQEPYVYATRPSEGQPVGRHADEQPEKGLKHTFAPVFFAHAASFFLPRIRSGIRRWYFTRVLILIRTRVLKEHCTLFAVDSVQRSKFERNERSAARATMLATAACLSSACLGALLPLKTRSATVRMANFSPAIKLVCSRGSLSSSMSL